MTLDIVSCAEQRTLAVAACKFVQRCEFLGGVFHEQMEEEWGICCAAATTKKKQYSARPALPSTVKVVTADDVDD